MGLCGDLGRLLGRSRIRFSHFGAQKAPEREASAVLERLRSVGPAGADVAHRPTAPSWLSLEARGRRAAHSPPLGDLNPYMNPSLQDGLTPIGPR